MTQNQRVLELARRRGPQGFSTVEFQPPAVVDGGPPIWRVAARIDNLKHRGCVFSSERLKDGTARYTLVSEPAIEQASGVDWETEAAAEPSVISASPDQPSPAPAELLSTLFDSRQFEVAA